MIAYLLAMSILLNPGCNSCNCGGLGRAYVGGTFGNIGGLAKTRLAQIDPLGLAVSAFTASLNATPNALYLDELNGMLWVGGDFTTVNGGAQAALVAVDWNTGDVLYAPTVTGNFVGLTTVLGLYADPATNFLYVTGDFKNVNGTVCTSAVRFTMGPSPTLDTAWLPVLDNYCQHAGVLGTTVYLCGALTLANGTGRAGGAAAVDSTTGTTTTAWNPAVNGGVNDILIRSTVSAFILGNFTRVNGGAGPIRRSLAEVDATAGTCTSWDPGANILNTTGVRLAPNGITSFFAAGAFTTAAGGVAVRSVAEFVDGGALDGSFRHVLVATRCDDVQVGADGRVYVCMGGGGDNGVFALSIVDGSTFQTWLPAADSGCTCIATSLTPI